MLAVAMPAPPKPPSAAPPPATTPTATIPQAMAPIAMTPVGHLPIATIPTGHSPTASTAGWPSIAENQGSTTQSYRDRPSGEEVLNAGLVDEASLRAVLERVAQGALSPDRGLEELRD